MTKQGRWFRKLRRIHWAVWKNRLGSIPPTDKELSRRVQKANRYTICWNGRVFRRRPELMSAREIEHRLFQGWTKRRSTPKRQRRFERWMAKTKARTTTDRIYQNES